MNKALHFMYTFDIQDRSSLSGFSGCRDEHSSMVHSLKQLSTFFVALIACAPLFTRPVFADAPQTSAKLMGVGSCSASNCHGSVKPLKGSKVLQNEYYTWLKHDKHSRAYLSLTNAEGKRMASLLGIADPTQERMCLECHATYIGDEASHGARYQIEDGVSCESCHGAAERWLPEHTASDATHETNLKNGLANIVPPTERAGMCLACHQGNQDKWVGHDLYGAGHPRLTFELDTFGALQPQHWVVDEDYVQRKGSYVPLRAWLVGQVVHAQGTLATLRSPERVTNGAFPELSLFDCFSCHHSLSEKQWKKRTYGGRPGRLKLNLPSLVIVQQALEVLEPGVAATMKMHLTTVHDSYQSDGATRALADLAHLVDSRLIEIANQVSSDEKICAALLERLGSYAASAPSPTYEVAEQLAMGIQAILASSKPLQNRYKRELKALFATLRSSEAFDPGSFSHSAKGFLRTSKVS